VAKPGKFGRRYTWSSGGRGHQSAGIKAINGTDQPHSELQQNISSEIVFNSIYQNAHHGP
jgi:hypothetical protein